MGLSDDGVISAGGASGGVETSVFMGQYYPATEVL
jgi:hypothetical protein